MRPGAAKRADRLSARAARFLQTAKGQLVLILTALSLAAGLVEGLDRVWPGWIAAAAGAVIIDAPILRWRKGRWVFPGGALLTGMIIAMILSPHEPWYVAAVTTAAGVLSKYVLRARSANVFNPAALALVANYYVYHSGHSWWGALPELPTPAVALLLATGIFIANRVQRIPAVLMFLGGYYLLFTLAAYLGDPARVAALYRAPDLHAALYCAFFMVTDPPTSPPRHRDQLIFGGIAALASFAIFELIGAVYFLPAGLLAANAWEGWRRWRPAGSR